MISSLLALSFYSLVTTKTFGTLLTEYPSKVVAERSFSLENRYKDRWVNDVFKDNILLTLAYFNHKIENPKDIHWEEIKKPQDYKLTLKPGEVFAFHEAILPQFKDKTVISGKAHFNFQDGFKSSGYLYGDGVCHLASLMAEAAIDAKLEVVSPTNHDFAQIPEVPKKYGVSIYYNPNNSEESALENLYITNTKDTPVTFLFVTDGKTLSVSILD